MRNGTLMVIEQVSLPVIEFGDCTVKAVAKVGLTHTHSMTLHDPYEHQCHRHTMTNQQTGPLDL
jgi:hypothetical protein